MIMLLLAALVAPVEASPEPVDVAALIECRGTMADFARFGGAMTEGAPRLGWRRIDGANPFLAEYRLPAPIVVFGRSTDHVAFAGPGILAVIDEPDPARIAGPLGVADQAPGAKFLGEKVVREDAGGDESGLGLVSRITLNVSTVDSHPGKTLAGCRYDVDMDEPSMDELGPEELSED